MRNLLNVKPRRLVENYFLGYSRPEMYTGRIVKVVGDVRRMRVLHARGPAFVSMEGQVAQRLPLPVGSEWQIYSVQRNSVYLVKEDEGTGSAIVVVVPKGDFHKNNFDILGVAPRPTAIFPAAVMRVLQGV
jgi:hypothetical protein